MDKGAEGGRSVASGRGFQERAGPGTLSNAAPPGKKMCRLGVKRGITTKELKTSTVFVTSGC